MQINCNVNLLVWLQFIYCLLYILDVLLKGYHYSDKLELVSHAQLLVFLWL